MEIEALSSHFPTRAHTPAEHDRWLSDFVADLGDLDETAVRRGCAEWRNSKTGRFPTPGQLRKVCAAYVRQLPAPPPQPWTAPTDAEYATLTLAEKIRTHTVLALEARMKAGPMWKNARPAGPDELGPEWHRWTAIAKNHEAEVARLQNKRQAAKEYPK